MPQDHPAKETAEAVFARIQRRRHLTTEPAPEAVKAASAPIEDIDAEPRDTAAEAEALRKLREALDQMKAERGSTGRPDAAPGASAFSGARQRDASTTRSDAGNSAFNNAEFIDIDEDGNPLPPRHQAGMGPEFGETAQHPDTFPRSRTLRVLLRHPEIGLLLAVPAATVLLRSSATRKALYRIGKLYAEREAWKQVDKLVGRAR